MGTNNHLTIVNSLLIRSGFSGQVSSQDLIKISGDGSDRLFYRLTGLNLPLIAVFPGSDSLKDLSEARSSYLIGRHLYEQGIPVPVPFVYDGDHGVLLFEDCGDLHLHDILSRKADFSEIDLLYRQVIDALILFQIKGKDGFDPDFCWDTPRYDMDLMLTRESGYFLASFCHDYLGLTPADPGLSLEFQELAQRAAGLPGHYLMHRDFQSRNILVQQYGIRIIDFQGARYGPLGYDLASLLIDPYAGLSREQESRFLEYYVSEISEIMPVDQEEFRSGYYLLSLQRNLQILGAFAYLSRIKKKVFFRSFITPALSKLSNLLQDSRGEDYPRLRALVSRLCERMILNP